MKLKSRVRVINIWSGKRTATQERKYRRPSMPQHPSTLPGEIAADNAALRASCFKFMRRLTRLPRRPMSHATLQQLGLAD